MQSSPMDSISPITGDIGRDRAPLAPAEFRAAELDSSSYALAGTGMTTLIATPCAAAMTFASENRCRLKALNCGSCRTKRGGVLPPRDDRYRCPARPDPPAVAREAPSASGQAGSAAGLSRGVALHLSSFVVAGEPALTHRREGSGDVRKTRRNRTQLHAKMQHHLLAAVRCVAGASSAPATMAAV
jgi:hypothetical protein